MTTTRPRVQQLHQSGATDQQVLHFDSVAGYWRPFSLSVVTICRTTFTAVGGESVIYLGDTPLANSEQVFVAGMFKHPGVDYTLSGTTLTLTSTVSAGQAVTVSYVNTSSTCHASSLVALPNHAGFKRPTPLTRPPRRFHRIR